MLTLQQKNYVPPLEFGGAKSIFFRDLGGLAPPSPCVEPPLEAWWHIGRVDAFGPGVRGFESHSSRHARYLGQVLHLQLPVAIRRVISDTVSIAVVGSASEFSGLKEALYKYPQ